MDLNPAACYRKNRMMIDTLAIIRPPATGDQELAQRLFTGLKDASPNVAMYSSAEWGDLAAEELSRTTLFVVSPGQCVEASGDESAFLSTVASARKRILAAAGPVEGPWYVARLSKGICFDTVFDIGFVSQKEQHSEVSDLPYHFVFNGLTREEEACATKPAHPEVRTIPWVLMGSKNDRHRDLLLELFNNKVDPRGLCFLIAPLGSNTAVQPMLSSSGLSAVLSRSRYYLWGSDRGVSYYESFRFVRALLAGAVPCKIDPDYPREGLDIPGIYPSVSTFQTEVEGEGYRALYRRARIFYASKGGLAEHLSKALRLV
jgi:hypothetical protein